MKFRGIVLMMSSLALFFTGCSKAEKSALNGKWNTISLVKEGAAEKVVDSFIAFTPEGKNLLVSGNSGVNNFFGSIKVKSISDEGNFNAGNFGSTKMMGAPEEQHFEDVFLEVLGKATSYSVKDKILTLRNESGSMEVKFIFESM